MAIPISLGSITALGSTCLAAETLNFRYPKSSRLNFGLNVLGSTATGLALKSLLGPGLLGTAALGTFIAAPICTKGIIVLSLRSGQSPNKVHIVAHYCDHLLRIATKTAFVVIMLETFAEQIMEKTFVSLATLVNTIKTIFIAENFLHEVCDTTLWIKQVKHKASYCLHFNFRLDMDQYTLMKKFVMVQNYLFPEKPTI